MGPQAKAGSSFLFIAVQCTRVFTVFWFAWQRGSGSVCNTPLPPSSTGAHLWEGEGALRSLSGESFLGTFPFSIVSDPV